jgi:hypothetical protein
VPSRVEIQCECAFTYMNAIIRKNLTDALAVDANEVDTASDTSGAFGDGRDRARFCRTIATCIWGVSDSLPTGPGTGSGGWQRGSLTPQMPAPLLPTAAPTVTRAANSAAQLTVVKLLIAKNITTSPADEITFLPRPVDQRTATSKEGTTPPESVVPPFFLRFRDSGSSPRGEIARI